MTHRADPTGITYYSCHRAGQFEPAAGEEYELAVGSQGQACTLSLVRLSLAAEGGVVRTPVSSLRDYGEPPTKRMGLPRWDPEEFCGKP